MNRIIRNGGVFLFATGCTVAGFMLADVQLTNLERIHLFDAPETVPRAPVAIILGASVKSDGTPSDALRDRLLVGIRLYEKRIVDKLLLSGDDGAYHADEIQVMQSFIRANGVPDENILIDGKGYRTYESCKRAKSVLHIDRAIVVTQRFHIGRAIYLCQKLGIDTNGVTSDLQTYVRGTYFWARDIIASLKAWWDIHIIPPKPPVA